MDESKNRRTGKQSKIRLRHVPLSKSQPATGIPRTQIRGRSGWWFWSQFRILLVDRKLLRHVCQLVASVPRWDLSGSTARSSRDTRLLDRIECPTTPSHRRWSLRPCRDNKERIHLDRRCISEVNKGLSLNELSTASRRTHCTFCCPWTDSVRSVFGSFGFNLRHREQNCDEQIRNHRELKWKGFG